MSIKTPDQFLQYLNNLKYKTEEVRKIKQENTELTLKSDNESIEESTIETNEFPKYEGLSNYVRETYILPNYELPAYKVAIGEATTAPFFGSVSLDDYCQFKIIQSILTIYQKITFSNDYFSGKEAIRNFMHTNFDLEKFISDEILARDIPPHNSTPRRLTYSIEGNSNSAEGKLINN